MIGVEMVEDPTTRAPLNPTAFVDIWEKCKDLGVLFGKGGINGNVSLNFNFRPAFPWQLIKFNFSSTKPNIFEKVFRIKPPMCITKEDAELALNVFEAALKNQLNN